MTNRGEDIDWKALDEKLETDPTFGTGLKEVVEDELKQAKAEGPEQYSQYLNGLSGIGTFAVKGTVYVPEYTKAFGDLVILPSQRSPRFLDSEEVDTDEGWPYWKGKLAYTMRYSQILDNGLIMAEVEEYAEQAAPRILYPESLERFDLYRLSVRDILARRDQRYATGILRLLGSE